MWAKYSIEEPYMGEIPDFCNCYSKMKETMSNILDIQNIVEKDILQETDWISNGYPTILH